MNLFRHSQMLSCIVLYINNLPNNITTFQDYRKANFTTFQDYQQAKFTCFRNYWRYMGGKRLCINYLRNFFMIFNFLDV